MTGVTIGIGEKFAALAAENASAVRKFYRVDDVLILTAQDVAAYCPPRRRFEDDGRHICFLKFCIPLLSTADRWLYFDADYRPIREPDAETLSRLHDDPRLLTVRDWWERPPYPWPYYNAGFYVANCDRHEFLFDWCRANYWSVAETFGDQCVWNRGIYELGIEVCELPRAFNVGRAGQCAEPIAVHGYWS